MIQLLIEHSIIEGPKTIHDPWFRLEYETATTNRITDFPTWIQNSAEWWSQGLVSDDEFLKSIEYLIKINAINFES